MDICSGTKFLYTQRPMWSSGSPSHAGVAGVRESQEWIWHIQIKARPWLQALAAWWRASDIELRKDDAGKERGNVERCCEGWKYQRSSCWGRASSLLLAFAHLKDSIAYGMWLVRPPLSFSAACRRSFSFLMLDAA